LELNSILIYTVLRIVALFIDIYTGNYWLCIRSCVTGKLSDCTDIWYWYLIPIFDIPTDIWYIDNILKTRSRYKRKHIPYITDPLSLFILFISSLFIINEKKLKTLLYFYCHIFKKKKKLFLLSLITQINIEDCKPSGIINGNIRKKLKFARYLEYYGPWYTVKYQYNFDIGIISVSICLCKKFHQHSII